MKGADPAEVCRLARQQSDRWEAAWSSLQESPHRPDPSSGADRPGPDPARLPGLAQEENERAQAELFRLGTLLWDPEPGGPQAARREAPTEEEAAAFPEPAPEPPPEPEIRPEPDRRQSFYQPDMNVIEGLIPQLRERKEKAANERYKRALAAWERDKDRAWGEYQERMDDYFREKAAWKHRRDAFLERRREALPTDSQEPGDILRGDRESVLGRVRPALTQDPAFVPLVSFPGMAFEEERGEFLVDVQLPEPWALPTLREVIYDPEGEEFLEDHVEGQDLGRLFDSVVYQVALRTVRVVFNGDRGHHVGEVTVNVWVAHRDLATGRTTRTCVASVQADRESTLDLELDSVDPRLGFEALGGRSDGRPFLLLPVEPLARTPGVEPLGEDLDHRSESSQLMALSPQEFQVAMQDIFHSRFSSRGTQLQIVKEDGDGELGAVAVDPDPIRGGKFILQARRVTTPLGAEPVRNLLGRVVQEGAVRGILISTAGYGPDALEFARGKPLTLMDQGALLDLLVEGESP